MSSFLTQRMRIRSVYAAVTLIAVGFFALPSGAATLTYQYTNVFTDGATAPDGLPSFATVMFDDGNTAGSVTMTIESSANIGIADLTRIYLNLDPSLDASQLNFSRQSGTASSSSETRIFAENDSSRAGGSGKYDVLFRFKNNTFNAAEQLVYEITGINSLTADSFNYLSIDSGGNGPFKSVAKFQSTDGGSGSAWISNSQSSGVPEVPVPASVWLLGSGLGFLCWKGRRSQKAVFK